MVRGQEPCSAVSWFCRAAISPGVLMVTLNEAEAQVLKSLAWELIHRAQTGGPRPQVGVALAACAVAARTVSVQVANERPFLVPEKPTVIATVTSADPGSDTDTLMLTVHEVLPLQLLWNWMFCSGLTVASGSGAPCSCRTSPCRTVNTGPMATP